MVFMASTGAMKGGAHHDAVWVAALEVEVAASAPHRIAREGMKADGYVELLTRRPEGVVFVAPPAGVLVG